MRDGEVSRTGRCLGAGALCVVGAVADGDRGVPSGGGRPWDVEGATTVFYGLSSDVPVPGDYNGDGSTERAVFRPEFGGWYVRGAATVFYGLGSDVPLPLPAAVYNEHYAGP